jgi:predicted nuclease of predicted toxin-antitoxin system
MKFLIDQNLSPKTANLLREMGHDAVDARERHLCSATDSELLRVAQSEKRIFVTLDLDFSDLRVLKSVGIKAAIVFRTRSFSSRHINHLLENFLSRHPEDEIMGKLFIVSENYVRSRHINI